MTTTTTLDRGGNLSYSVQIDGWYSYINGGEYTSEQQDKLAEALMSEQEKEFDSMLPDGCFWSPRASEITGPVGTDLDAALSEHAGRGGSAVDDALEAAGQKVIARFGAIEREAIGT